MHGDKDVVVPVSFLLEAKELFNKMNYKIQTKILKTVNIEYRKKALVLGLEFIKKNLY